MESELVLCIVLTKCRWLLVAMWSLTSAAPWCEQLKFFEHTLQRNMCGSSRTADTNGQAFFHSGEKLVLYLNAPANFAFLLIGGPVASSSLVLVDVLKASRAAIVQILEDSNTCLEDVNQIKRQRNIAKVYVIRCFRVRVGSKKWWWCSTLAVMWHVRLLLLCKGQVSVRFAHVSVRPWE